MYEYKAKLIRVVDGDTCDALIDLGFNTWVKKRIRFKGVDTWESRTRNKEEKKKGLLAKAFTKKQLEKEEIFRLISHGVGKYGRVLGEIFISDNEESLNDRLIREGHAYTYEGGKKRSFNG